MRWGLSPAAIAQIQAVLAQFPAVTAAKIFGSRALGTHRNGSDIDLALLGNGPLDCTLRISALLNQDSPLPHHFDVVDYAQIEHTALREHIDTHGQEFYRREHASHHP